MMAAWALAWLVGMGVPATSFAAQGEAVAAWLPTQPVAVSATCSALRELGVAADTVEFEEEGGDKVTAQVTFAPDVGPSRVGAVLRHLDASPLWTQPIDAVSDVWYPSQRVQRVLGARAPPLG